MMSLPPSLVALRRLISKRACSAGEALQAQYRHIREEDEHWHSATHFFPLPTHIDHTLPLAGIGLAHKDIFTMRGRTPGCGAAVAPSWKQPCTAIRNLSRAGSEPMAALSMAEFAAGITGDNPNLPRPVNPISTNAMVGGSSSGSAVAVAAGLCYASLGTDTAGSIRVPAATCGILGLKTTRGLLPTTGCYPLAPSLDTIGVMARSALDAAQVLAASMSISARKRIFSHLPPTSDALSDNAWDNLDKGLPMPDHWRLAWCPEHEDSYATPSEPQARVLETFMSWIARFAHVSHVSLTNYPELTRHASVVLHAECTSTHAHALRTPSTRPLSPTTRALALPGAAMPAFWYAESQALQHELTMAFLTLILKDNDMLVTPILPQGVPDWSAVLPDSPEFDPRALIALFSWTAFVNYMGLPAITFPIGEDEKGRPVCIQVIGKPRTEALLLAFAWRIQQERYAERGFSPASSPAEKANH